MGEAARTGDRAHCDADAHGCPACPHAVEGEARAGSPNVVINGAPALRVGDKGSHEGCCGDGVWRIVGGAPGVVINGRRAARSGDPVSHCGGSGVVVGGSGNVVIGDYAKPGAPKDVTWVCYVVTLPNGRPMPGVKYSLTTPDGATVTAATDEDGEAFVDRIPPGECSLAVHEMVVYPLRGG